MIRFELLIPHINLPRCRSLHKSLSTLFAGITDCKVSDTHLRIQDVHSIDVCFVGPEIMIEGDELEKKTFSPVEYCQGPLYVSGQVITVTVSMGSRSGAWFVINGNERNGTCTKISECKDWYVLFHLFFLY